VAEWGRTSEKLGGVRGKGGKGKVPLAGPQDRESPWVRPTPEPGRSGGKKKRDRQGEEEKGVRAAT